MNTNMRGDVGTSKEVPSLVLAVLAVWCELGLAFTFAAEDDWVTCERVLFERNTVAMTFRPEEKVYVNQTEAYQFGPQSSQRCVYSCQAAQFFAHES